MEFGYRSLTIANQRNEWMARAIVFIAMSMMVLAQVGANVGGVVTDSTGAAVSGATVTVTNTTNGESHVLKASPQGAYRAVNLPPAQYQITVEATGFGTSRKDVDLLVGSDVTVDFPLGVAGVSETVTVTGEAAALVETTTSAPKSVIDGGQLADLPVLNRDFLVVAQNMPGAASTTNLATTNRFSVTKFGGVADQSSGYTTLIDGAAIDDATWGAPVINMSQDAIQEFTVFRNQFDAQYGHALNAVVSVATKSGGDELHGTFYYFGRDADLNAKNAFATVTPPYTLFRGGITVGGPIKKGRTHYFGSIEYLDVHTAGIEALPVTNPFASQENGNYPFTQTEKIGDFKVDHSFTDTNLFYARYAYDHFFIPSGGPPNSQGTYTDDSRAHSLVLEDNWTISPTAVNTLRYTFLHHDLSTLPGNYNTAISYLDFSFGQNHADPQFFPRTNHILGDTFFINKSKHDIKFGGEVSKQFTSYLSHYYENGLFQFTNDGPFNAANPATWPVTFTQQTAGDYYHHSWAFGPFIQDDWRVLPRLRLNLGLRYDFETNLRDNQFYTALLQNPAFTGINHFVSPNRGTDYTEGLQPRAGVAWDVTGKGEFVVRGGFGRYTTRDREYWPNAAEAQSFGAAVVITNPQQLQYFPSITNVLNGQSLASYVTTSARSLILLANNFKLPYSMNLTGGFGWKINAQSSLNVDVVHTHDLDDLGETDANLPATGAVTAANPRPVSQFTQVAEITPNGQSWYQAVEVQYRTAKVKGFQNVSVSYTFSKSIIDGVTWYSTFSGTDRFADNYAYNPTNTPNNLSLTWTSVMLPGKIQLSGAFHAVSGPPFSVSAGFDLDGDGNVSGDRPRGLPQTVGYGDVGGQLALINAFRANPCSFVYFSTVTCTAKSLPPISINQLEHHPSVSLDMRLSKVITFNEKKHLDLFFEGYNITNFVTLLAGSGTMTSTSFLIPTGSLPARQLQWGARFSF